ncbi:MAG: serpin family protein [Gemmatimonadetes bacterium]|nr:serpin family protein [Gemmatimonadota bacterium]
MKTRILLVCIPLLVWACGDSTGPIGGLPRQLSSAETQLVETDNRFALKLFQEINRLHLGKNVFISPLSAGMALGMTYNGSAGTTQEAMQRALQLEGLTVDQINTSYQSLIELLRGLDSRVQFQLANAIWYRQGFAVKAPFLDVNKRYFDATVSALDFGSPSAVTTINQWVKDKTAGRIDKMVDQIDPEIVMLLMNAIYFKASWTQQFDKSRTANLPFTLIDGTTKSVPTMFGPDHDFGSFSNASVRAIDLPYGGAAYSMTILSPAAGRNADSLVAVLDQTLYSAAISGLHDGGDDFYLPKFTLSFGVKMNDALAALGMQVAFDPGAADFSKIGDGLYLSFVQQKTWVDVNEEGTEAAAVTNVGVGVTSAREPTRVDRPFVFVIRERFSGAILFMGKIMDPTVTTAGTN